MNNSIGKVFLILLVLQLLSSCAKEEEFNKLEALYGYWEGQEDLTVYKNGDRVSKSEKQFGLRLYEDNCGFVIINGEEDIRKTKWAYQENEVDSLSLFFLSTALSPSWEPETDFFINEVFNIEFTREREIILTREEERIEDGDVITKKYYGWFYR